MGKKGFSESEDNQNKCVNDQTIGITQKTIIDGEVQANREMVSCLTNKKTLLAAKIFLERNFGPQIVQAQIKKAMEGRTNTKILSKKKKKGGQKKKKKMSESMKRTN